MLVTGEASGDLHASGLIRELKCLVPSIYVYGVGGDRLQQEGMELLYHIRQMSVLGFGDVIKQFAFFRRVFRHLVRKMDEYSPDLLILIDYPGLNLKLAKAAKQRGIPVFYYIAPQVWAWGAGRIPKMVKIIDKLAVIIPFEEALFRQAGLDTQYVGHPLMAHRGTSLSREAFYQKFRLNKDRKIVGLLPGSRITEVKRLLPEMIKTVTGMADVQIIISKASTIDTGIHRDLVNSVPGAQTIEGYTPEIMAYSDVLLVASGTATLEAGLYETPLIVVYRVDPLSYWIGKRLVKVDNIGLVNVIAGKQIVPEFIQHQFTADAVRPVLQRLLIDTTERERITAELKKLKQTLGQKKAAENAAQMAASMLADFPSS